MEIRELIEGIIVIACGIVLLSPEFNIVIAIPWLEFMSSIPDELISHLAIGLVPIILVYMFDMFRYNKTD